MDCSAVSHKLNFSCDYNFVSSKFHNNYQN